ncbi:hypothetical protein OAF98_00025 [Planctomicrobium sp.]|jgi:type VI secretion system protein ImpE|nr:type VI secretion system accessory protein TagJ [Planctomicrobium sp.]MBT5018465.1 SciE type virulence protein [Planctomicrobium sp.]MDA7528031.1 SciE type virulence protein [bacterium]MDB4742842.1 hypothetical protein [Planctomicrobium sp.]
MSKSIELFQSGQLDAAVEQAAQDVKASPSNITLRSLFAEFLCFTRDWQRVDKQLDAISKIDKTSVVGVSLLKHLLRSEVSREEAYEQGRVPEFVEKPSESMQKRLEALTHFRSGDAAKSVELIAEAVEMEVPVTGAHNGEAFSDFRDMDDLLGPIVEVFTATGEYYWLDLNQVRSLELDSPSNLVDQLWRSARIETVGDLRGRIYLPALYYGSDKSEDGRTRIGRATDWDGGEGSPVTGKGQREFLVGEEPVTIMQLSVLTFGE